MAGRLLLHLSGTGCIGSIKCAADGDIFHLRVAGHIGWHHQMKPPFHPTGSIEFKVNLSSVYIIPSKGMLKFGVMKGCCHRFACVYIFSRFVGIDQIQFIRQRIAIVPDTEAKLCPLVTWSIKPQGQSGCIRGLQPVHTRLVSCTSCASMVPLAVNRAPPAHSSW